MVIYVKICNFAGWIGGLVAIVAEVAYIAAVAYIAIIAYIALI